MTAPLLLGAGFFLGWIARAIIDRAVLALMIRVITSKAGKSRVKVWLLEAIADYESKP